MSDIVDNVAAQRFEMTIDGATALAAYERRGDTIVFTHTIVPQELRGRGVATRLVAGAVAAARADGLSIVPQCPFVAAYLERHPDGRLPG